MIKIISNTMSLQWIATSEKLPDFETEVLGMFEDYTKQKINKALKTVRTQYFAVCELREVRTSKGHQQTTWDLSFDDVDNGAPQLQTPIAWAHIPVPDFNMIEEEKR